MKASSVHAAESESEQGYSPFEGQELTGRVKSTFLRGALIYDQGRRRRRAARTLSASADQIDIPAHSGAIAHAI